MNGELARWAGSTAVERAHGRELAAMERRAELAAEQVAGIARVTARATVETMKVNVLRREAERVAPDGAEMYAMLAIAGTVEMAQVIGRVGRSR